MNRMTKAPIKVLLIALISSLISFQAHAEKPDLTVIQNSGHIMGPGDVLFPVHKGWAELHELMKHLDIYDRVADKIASVLCSDNINKSVLLVGEPSTTYKYVWARLAARGDLANCPKDLWHAEVDINKIEAGHMYVGQVEQYWQDKILEPMDGKSGVWYMPGLGRLIGLGSHSNDSTGIEAEYAANIQAGRFRAVSFITKFNYNNLQFSEHTYVLAAHAEVIKIEEIAQEEIKKLVRKYLEIFEPRLTLTDINLQYMMKTVEYFQPNIEEPQRSMTLLKHLIRNQGASFDTLALDSDIATPNPYASNSNLKWDVAVDGMDEVQIEFEYFYTQQNYDFLKVRNKDTGELVKELSGNLGASKTPWIKGGNLELNFTSSSYTNYEGFKIKKIHARKRIDYTFTREDVRRSILSMVNVPEWLVEKDWTVIKELPKKLDDDVVGIKDAKRDVLRAIENGYVAGRTDEKPIGTSLLVGPTGTGKTYIAKKVAEFMNLRLITFDMTQFRTDESFDRFQEILSQALVMHPYAIYLFEEIDKASIKVLDRLYMIMDEGIFYDKFQRKLFARGAFIMMTTNTAKDVIIANQHAPNLKQLVNEALQEHFRHSFLNRFDTMSIFKPFTDAEFHQLATIMVKKKVAKLKEYFDWNLMVEQRVIDYLGQNGQSALYGARPMERLIENVISTGLTKYQLYVGNLLPDANINLDRDPDLGKHFFKVMVDGRGEQTYEIDLDNNSGKSFDRLFPEISAALKEARMY